MSYKNKYYKFENDGSWLYSHCKKELSNKEGEFDIFEFEKRIEFRANAREYFFICQIEISEEEYIKALITMASAVGDTIDDATLKVKTKNK